MVYSTFLVALSVTGAQAQAVIHTIAGTGGAGLSGDGGPALAATFSGVAGVAVDGSGNLYIADIYNSRIRMVSAATGNVSTVAGTTCTYIMSGMGGLATHAHLIYPNALAFDAAGNYYASDWFADAAYKVTVSTGDITNICGHDSQGCSGDGGFAPDATMEIPGGIAVDAAGNIYIADHGNSRIRKVDALTSIVSTIAGAGSGGVDGVPAVSASFGSINGVCVDHAGNVYISDAGFHTVRKIDNSGIVRTIAGNGTAGYSGDGGSALSASLMNPSGLFINSNGMLFICDDQSNCVRVVNINTGVINTLAGNGSYGFSGDGGLPTAAMLAGPTGVWQDAAGSVYIADQGNNRVRKVTGATAYYRTTGINNLTGNEVSIYPNPSAGTFTVATNGTGTIDVFNMTGAKVFTGTIDEQATFTLNEPAGVYSAIIKTDAGTSAQKITIVR